jgi:hypothetical protein
MRALRWILPLCVATTLASVAPGQARSRGLRVAPAPDKVRIDGVPKEWQGDWRELSHVHKGSGDDLGAQAVLASDDKYLYVAAQVNDDKLVGGADRVELLLGIPGGSLHSMLFYPGQPGKSRAAAKTKGGAPIRGAKVVEAPTAKGYAVEARIPWSSIPKSRTVRVGYRGALFVHDVDSGRSVDTIIGSADSRDYRSLPPVSLGSEIALGSGLLRQKNITRKPSHNLMANVVGDRMRERVLVYGPYLVVFGPGYRSGGEYYFRDVGGNSYKEGLPRFEVKDVTGDGLGDFILQKKVRGSKGSVEVLEILSYAPGGDTPQRIFAQEVALDLEQGSIRNKVSIQGAGRGTRIVIKPGRARGLDEDSNFDRVSNTGVTPVLTPWGEIASQTYGVRQGRFQLLDEKKQKGKAPRKKPKPKGNQSVIRHQGESGAALDKVYAHYKKERGVRGRARFDLNANVVDDKRKERLVVHGLDLVVFGDGFRGGRGYAAATIGGFDKPSDVHSVTTRDVTGDGRHEILVTGIQRVPMPADMGSGTIERTLLIIYKLQGSGFAQVFGAEIGRRVGGKKVRAKVVYAKSGRYRIQLRGGSASGGWSEANYPWVQKTEPSSNGFESLVLPWSGHKVRLRYDGRKFVR